MMTSGDEENYQGDMDGEGQYHVLCGMDCLKVSLNARLHLEFINF